MQINSGQRWKHKTWAKVMEIIMSDKIMLKLVAYTNEAHKSPSGQYLGEITSNRFYGKEFEVHYQHLPGQEKE